MKFQRSAIRVVTATGIATHNLFVAHEPPSDKLLVMLPGQGYTCDHPVMHYLRKMAAGLGHDVLSLQYSFQAAPDQVSRQQLDWDKLYAEVGAVMREVQGRGYKQICFAGKSLGTPVAVMHAREQPARDTRIILLTPISDSVESAGKTGLPTLAIIGTADPVYEHGQVNADSADPNVTWRVFDGLNHALETEDDWQASIAALHEVIAACEAFLR